MFGVVQRLGNLPMALKGSRPPIQQCDILSTRARASDRDASVPAIKAVIATSFNRHTQYTMIGGA